MHEQINRFAESLSKSFFDNAPLQLNSWEDAFKLLVQQINKYSDDKVVIFLDELPWLATRRSGLIKVIDYYWNHYWSKLKNVILIACGSSAAWLMKNIVYDKGGLHNRITCEINLKPFNLSEVKEFLIFRKIKLNNKHILKLYMALGGVPSLFTNADAYMEIITLLSKTKIGLSRSEIDNKTKYSTNGGRLSERLRDLCSAGFIEERISWHKKKGEYYKLIDEFFCSIYTGLKTKVIKNL